MSLRSPLTITRGGGIDPGSGMRDDPTTITIEATVQPVTRQAEIDAYAALANGRRLVTLRTDTQLHDTNSDTPDSFEWQSEKFEVLVVNPWQNGILNHYECVCAKAGIPT